MKKKILTANQERFCQLYVSPETEFYGNGTQSYIEAYSKKTGNHKYKDVKIPSIHTASSGAYNLLQNPAIIERISELLDARGFNDENVDKQHLFLLNQFTDFKSKLGAIKEYNSLKKRTVKGIDLTTKGKSLSLLLDEDEDETN